MISARARIYSVRYGLAVSRIKNVHSGCAWRFFTFWRVLLSDSLSVASSSNKNQSAVTCGYPSCPIVASMATSALRRSWCDSGKVVICVLLLQRTITASASSIMPKGLICPITWLFRVPVIFLQRGIQRKKNLLGYVYHPEQEAEMTEDPEEYWQTLSKKVL